MNDVLQTRHASFNNTSASNAQHRYAPSERVRALVEPLVPQIVARAGSAGLLALVVVGSAARGEETWHGAQLAGDIDFGAVVASPNPWTARRVVRAAASVGVEIGCFPHYSLRRYRTLEFYEAKQSAWVLWGQPDVFADVPMHSAADIPHWEGLRLLLNRAMHCLEARAGMAPTWYAAVKTYLALGEAELVFANRYVPSYRGRWTALWETGTVCGSRALLERVEWATRAKLSGAQSLTRIDPREHEQALLDGLALLFGRYLETQITAAEGLEQVARRTYNPLHRAAHLAHQPFDVARWRAARSEDPIFPIWRRALDMLHTQQFSQTELLRLLTAWRSTRQPLPR